VQHFYHLCFYRACAAANYYVKHGKL